MEPLLTLRDENIFPNNSFRGENTWEGKTERVVVRCIVIDSENNIAFCGVKHKLLPGGGVEIGEILEQAAVRECLEEIGCHIEIISKLGFVEEYRDGGKRHQTTHCFVAKIIGEKGVPTSTQEDELNMKVYFESQSELLEALEEQVKAIPFESYNSCFNVRVTLAFVREYLKGNK